MARFLLTLQVRAGKQPIFSKRLRLGTASLIIMLALMLPNILVFAANQPGDNENNASEADSPAALQPASTLGEFPELVTEVLEIVQNNPEPTTPLLDTLYYCHDRI